MTSCLIVRRMELKSPEDVGKQWDCNIPFICFCFQAVQSPIDDGSACYLSAFYPSIPEQSFSNLLEFKYRPIVTFLDSDYWHGDCFA